MLEMEKTLRIFAYDLEGYTLKNGHPLYIKSSQCGVDSGHNKGYGVEKYFISQINKSLLRTVDPNKSVIFFIPVKLCAAKWNLPPLPQPKKIKNILGRKLSAQYFYKSVEFVSKRYPYFNGSLSRFSGADHFWFSSHDGGVARASLIKGNFTSKTIALVNTADPSMGFIPCWHISTVPNVDFGRPPSHSAKKEIFFKLHRRNIVFFAGNLASNPVRLSTYHHIESGVNNFLFCVA
ncbi:uncharacterized protein LOC135119672 [Zophobas morio]|uniref:uncharacterized protein LOC135119672 n=1 Tax=Zophobas morio TaxID=2755281 RepID=UPI0030828600